MTSHEIKELLTDGDICTVKDKLYNDPSLGTAVLSAILTMAEDAKEKYRHKGIQDTVYNDTMADISVWSANYFRKTGYCGIDELGWIMNHINLKLFALGRLQFRPSGFYYNDNWTKLSDCPINIGDNILEIHIPQGKPLLSEDCELSFKQAPSFFKTYFNYDYCYYTCHSWLLSPVLKEILPKSSNIVKFQNRFTIIATEEATNEAEERIFDKKFGGNTNSSLAKKVKELSEQGIKIGSGIGIIKREI